MFCPLSHMCISLTFQHLICFTVSLLGSFIGLSPGISSGLLSSCPLTLVLLSLSHLPWFVRCLSPYVPCHVLLFSSVKLTKVSRSVVSPYISFPFLFLVRHLFSSLVSVKVACLSLRLIVSLVCYFYSPLSNTCYVQFNFSCPPPCNQCFLFPCYSVCIYYLNLPLLHRPSYLHAVWFRFRGIFFCFWSPALWVPNLAARTARTWQGSDSAL